MDVSWSILASISLAPMVATTQVSTSAKGTFRRKAVFDRGVIVYHTLTNNATSLKGVTSRPSAMEA